MSITRAQLPQVHGFDNRIQWNDAVSRTNDRLVRWVFGTGFLAVHLAIFGTALVTALCWNLVSDPTDLRVVEPFRYWGIVTIVHTILAGGGVIGWRLFQMGKPQTRDFQVPVRSRAIAAPRPQMIDRVHRPETAWSTEATTAQAVDTAPRRWNATTLRKAAPWAGRDVKQGWPGQPAMMRSISEAGETDATFVDVGEATWPDSAPLSTTLMAQSDARSGPDADHVVSVDHRPEAGTSAPSQTWIEGFIESRTRDKEHRWSWVEAAASSWLSRRDAPSEAESTHRPTSASSVEPDAAPEPLVETENPGSTQA